MDRNVVLANFQACTAIDDIGICMAMLDQHDWDLQNAVHAALQGQDNEASNSSNVQSSRPRSPPRPSRQINFVISANGSEIFRSMDEGAHVGTLLQILAVEANLKPDDPLQFTGWPSGEQPHNELPLSVLGLPTTVRLTHTDPNASSRISEQEQRKDRHFVLNIRDVANDERHTLKYPGRKIMSDIKRDVYSLTIIPEHRQVWSGWPDNYAEQSQLWQLQMSGFELNLTVDDSRPSLNQNHLSLNRPSNPKPIEIPSDSESENEIEDDDEPYDDAFQDIEMTASRTRKALISNTGGDYGSATLELVTEFQRRFGEQTPIWFIGGLQEAASEAYGNQTKTSERKMLAIYIHNEKSISANIFCSQILCSTAIVTFLSENCISWGFDITEYENKVRVYNQIDKMFGSQMASSLRRMADDEFPILILASGKGSTNEATDIVKGDSSIDDVMTKLLTSLDISNSKKREDMQTELERVERDNEISEQESAYEQSQRADRERMLRSKDEEDKKKKDLAKIKETQDQNQKAQQDMENKLTPEPTAQEKNCCELRFRFPDGKLIARRFRESEKLSSLFIFMGSEGYQEASYRLLRQFPRGDLSSLKRSKSLKELGLKQDNLVVEAQINDESSDDDSDDESMDS